MKIKERSLKTIIRDEQVTKDGCYYRYKLMMTKSSKVASYRIPLYSIEIEMKDSFGELTECSVDNIFADLGKAVVFYDRMIRNLATPIDLPYIVEDEIFK